jgi:hypothetical protein
VEIILLEVKPFNQKPFILGYVYRPPSSWNFMYEDTFEKLICEIWETFRTRTYKIRSYPRIYTGSTFIPNILMILLRN